MELMVNKMGYLESVLNQRISPKTTMFSIHF